VSTPTDASSATTGRERVKIPRDPENDYTREAARARRDFLRDQTGAELEHVAQFSFDPSSLPGNVEQFLGVAQVPIGVAGPLLVDGEHARGEYYVPLATAEGTLVASYNRGMKLLREAGGVTTTVVDDAMQRAPAFVFDSAREARAFGNWLQEHFEEIKRAAESTTRSGQLRDIEQTRRAGSCSPDSTTPPATPPVERHMHISSAQLFRARQVSNLGGFMSGVNNNGAHSANGITALFIATGQDVANVAESSAAFVFAELGRCGEYYYSVTIPSLIVATYGGGTGLATQRECLELLGCYGSGNVRKFAEIVAATVLCGELSLGSAVVAEEWVNAHDPTGVTGPRDMTEERA
jgi:hydroxymethylglutaryl-CoA reductase (NADPH)